MVCWWIWQNQMFPWLLILKSFSQTFHYNTIQYTDSAEDKDLSITPTTSLKKKKRCNCLSHSYKSKDFEIKGLRCICEKVVWSCCADEVYKCKKLENERKCCTVVSCFICFRLKATSAATSITHPNLHLSTQWSSCIVGNLGTRFYKKRITICLPLLHRFWFFFYVCH